MIVEKPKPRKPVHKPKPKKEEICESGKFSKYLINNFKF